MNILYIIVSQYPYGFGEPFLEDELRVHELRFDKIFIVIPDARGLNTSQAKFYVPLNAEIVTLDIKFGWYTKFILTFSSFFDFIFWEEVMYVKRVYKLPFSIAILKQMMAYIGKKKEFLLQFEPLVASTNGNVTLYTYWCTEYSLAIGEMKQRGIVSKAVTRLHGWDVYFERNTLNYLPFRKTIFDRLDNVVSISENGKKYLAHKVEAINPNKIVNMYLGTPDGVFKELTTAGKRLNVLSVSFLTYVKRVDRLVDALALIDEIEIHWTHIGGGKDEDDIKTLASKKLSGKQNIRFEFLGNKTKTEVYDLFRANDYHVIINSSESEGLPVSLMEAMSFGVPAIAPCIGGIPEMITHNQNGYILSTVTSPIELATAIRQLSQLDATAYAAMRTNAYNTWHDKFNAEVNYNRFADCLTTDKLLEYHQCSRCILDTNDYPEITFNDHGVCNICSTYGDLSTRTILKGTAGDTALHSLIDTIKDNGKGKEYDCLIGVSGGVDSTYLAYLTKQWGLRPLVVHVDNGWNTELAVSNIERLLDILGFDLYTHVIDWEEMRDIQRAFMRADVVDIDLPFDNAFMSILYKLAAKHNIKYVLSGHNTATEGYLPPNFTHFKMDSLNIRDIHKKFGQSKLKKFPIISLPAFLYYERMRKINIYTPLNWIDYNKAEVKKIIQRDLGWRDYGGKHYENIYTRFYQGYILYEKFKVDKRKSHLSTLICSGQITKADALEEVKKLPYPNQDLLKADKAFFIKKMRMTEAELDAYIQAPEVPHTHYRSYVNVINTLRPFYRLLIKPYLKG
jgi:N-acetyl sugar amidotransferase